MTSAAPDCQENAPTVHSPPSAPTADETPPTSESPPRADPARRRASRVRSTCADVVAHLHASADTPTAPGCFQPAAAHAASAGSALDRAPPLAADDWRAAPRSVH